MKELLIAIYFLICKVNLLPHLWEDFITATKYLLEWDSNFGDNERLTEATLSLQLPPFNPVNIQTWFAQLQAIFIARIVTLQKTKFAHVVGKLPIEVAPKILNLLNTVWGESIWHTEKQFYTRLVSQKKINYQVFVIMSPLKILHLAQEYVVVTMAEQATELWDPKINPLVRRYWTG